jgi:copper transport protein
VAHPKVAVRRVVPLLACVCLVLLGTAGPAAAHAVLVATQPSSLAVLPSAPHRVTLTFGEQVQVSPDGVRVLAPDGSRVDDRHAGQVDGHGDTVGVGVTATAAQGTYTVAWRMVSADSHPVSGAFTYSVGHTSATTAPPPSSGSTAVTVLYWTSRVLGYAGYALLVGAVAFVLLCWPGGAGARRVRGLVRLAWPLLLATTVADALLQGPYGAGVGLAHLFDGTVLASTLALPLGTGLALRVTLLAVAMPLVHEVLSGGRRMFGWLCAPVLAGVAVTWSMSGHAATGGHTALALPADVLHLAAMGVWLGGLVVLWRTTPPAEAVRRFSRVAFTCVAALVATGTYQSWRQLGGWLTFVDTGYGRLLLLKIGAVAVVLAAAWFSRRWVRGRAGSLRHSVLVETAGAVVVLALTAALVDADPPRTPVLATTAAARSTPDRGTIPFNTGGPGGAGKLKVAVLPLTTGPNIVTVTVLDPVGRRTDVAEVDVALTLQAQGIGPLRLTMRHVGMGAGTYRSADADISLPGTWLVAVTVRTSDIDETTVTEPVTVTR